MILAFLRDAAAKTAEIVLAWRVLKAEHPNFPKLLRRVLDLCAAHDPFAVQEFLKGAQAQEGLMELLGHQIGHLREAGEASFERLDAL